MKQTGMLVVSLRGVNLGFWPRLGCSGQSANILCHTSSELLYKSNRPQVSMGYKLTNHFVIGQGSKFIFGFGSTCATRCKFLGALPKF